MNKKLHDQNILTVLPRQKKVVQHTSGFKNPPMMKSVSFKTRHFKVLGRLILWTYAVLHFLTGILWDKVRGRNNEKSQAIRLRKTFERMGGTMIKFGQQLSLRVDVLPYTYCDELSQLLDRRPAFHLNKAIDRIETVSGKKLNELFLAFDPTPIGSASIACVYQAVLKNGKKVAVKVRRPGIGELFAADFAALNIVCIFLEFFTILRPGFTKTFREGLRDALMEELDFRREARYQQLFRHSAKKAKTKFVKAPKVYFKYSGEDVLIMQYITGIMLSEVLAAVEQNDEKALALFRQKKIKPKRIAKRLLWVNHSAMISELFFHADPNPANVIVLDKSKLVFIDFGSCGSFSYSQKKYLKQINYYQNMGDPEGMAQASVGMLEPLPPIHVNVFSKELEKLYRTSVYAMADKKSEWWERTTAVQWFAFMKAAMMFRLPLPLNVLHMVRATLLYDTIAARLDNKIVFYNEFRRYERFAGKKVRKRMHKKLKRTITRGIDPKLYLQAEQLIDTGQRFLFRIQRFLGSPPLQFKFLISKGYYGLSVILKLMMILIGITGLIVFSITAKDILAGQEPNLIQITRDLILLNGWYQIFVAVASFLGLRRILFRFDDVDHVLS